MCTCGEVRGQPTGVSSFPSTVGSRRSNTQAIGLCKCFPPTKPAHLSPTQESLWKNVELTHDSCIHSASTTGRALGPVCRTETGDPVTALQTSCAGLGIQYRGGATA